MNCYSLGPYSPDISPDAYIAPGSLVIGRVQVAEGASIWFNCVLRGDVSNIKVGRYTNVQDGSIIHGAKLPVQMDVEVGEHVTIGHNAIIHGCKIDNYAFIGMGAIILNGAHIGKGSVIGAGALVPEGRVIPEYAVVMGVPAKIIRYVTDEEKDLFVKINDAYHERSKLYMDTLKPQSI